MRKIKFKKLSLVPISVLVLQFLLPAMVAPVHADEFTQAFVRLDTMVASTATGGRVCADPVKTSSNTEDHVNVTFPTGFTVNGTAGNWTVNTSNLDSGQTAWTGINTATAVSGQTVTFASGNITETGSTLYCFNFSGTNTLTNSTAGTDKNGTIVTETSGNATIDSSAYALAVIADDSIDISATVNATFSFVLSGTSDTLGTLASGSVSSSAGKTVTVNTNGSAGWIAWAKSANAGLTSSTASHTINTAGTVNGAPSTLSAGTEGYVLDVDETTDGSGGCTLNADAEYDGGANAGGTLSTNFQPIATCDGGTATNDVITLVEKAAISGGTAPAADYADIITVVGAGRF